MNSESQPGEGREGLLPAPGQATGTGTDAGGSLPASRKVSWRAFALAAGLALVVALSGFSLVAPGRPTSVDVWPHLVRQRIVYESLRTGTSPFWSFMFYAGYPHLRFYGPLLALLGGILAIIARGNQVLALEALLFGLHLGSAVAMYWYLWRKTGRRSAAAVGALVYALVPWRVLFVSIAGNYPLALVYLLLPLCFLSLERLEAGGGRTHSWLLGLFAGFAVLTHVVYAAFAFVLLGLALVWWLAASRPSGRQAGRVLSGAGVAAVCGLGLASFVLVPLVLEFRTHAYPQPDVWLGPPRLAVLLWPWGRFGGYDGAYLGISVLILAAASAVLLLASREQRREAAFPVAGLLLALGLAFAVPRLGRIGQFLGGGLPPVRFLVFWVFFAAVLAALGYSWFEGRFLKTGRARFIGLLVLAAVLAADCLPTLLNVRYLTAEKFLQSRKYVYDVLGSRHPARVLDVSIPEDRIDELRRTLRYPAVGYIFGGLASPFGPPYHQFAPRSMLYVYPWANYVAADLGDTARPALTQATLKAVALMGVSHLITLPALLSTDSTEELLCLATKRGIAWDDRFLVAEQEPPLVFGPTRAGLVMASNVVRPMPAERVAQAGAFCIADDWQAVLDQVSIDTALRRMSYIPVLAQQAEETLGPAPDCRVLETEVGNSMVSIRLENRSECFLRLALSYYPELSVRLDGREAEFHETKDHFIWLRCPQGGHRLTVSAPLGSLRTMLLAVGIATLLACVFMTAVSTGRTRQGPGDRR